MQITVLGTGTSTGIPVPGCDCEVCSSTDPKNKRLRCSLHIALSDNASSILIDTSTDLRQQALIYSIKRIDAVLYTHAHADHTHGIDDLRSYNFIQKTKIPVFAETETAEELKQKFPYVFHEDPDYEGGAPAKLDLNVIEPDRDFQVKGKAFTPLVIQHGKKEILGFRIDDFAYLTDCSGIPEATLKKLSGLDTIILDGLRHRPHNTHFTVEQAVEQLEIIKPKKAYLTHISHDLEHNKTNEKLETMTEINVELAYDGLVLDF